jgi:flagellin-like hook-associated protein FlgL
MIGGTNSVTSGLASIYNANTRALSESLGRIASGKRIQKPSDDFAGYIKSRSLLNEVSAYTIVKQDLLKAKGYADYAMEAGTAMMGKLERVKELAVLYASTSDPDEQALYVAENLAIRDEITALVADSFIDNNAAFQVGSLIDVELDPVGVGGTFNVAFVATDYPTAAEILLLVVTDGGTTADAAIGKVTSYLTKASGYSEDIQRHMDLTDIVINSKEAAASLITDIDEVKEMATATDLQIRQQASIAMIAQANISQQGILQLYL